MDQSQSRDQIEVTASYCYWHPDAETGLSCSQCAKPICPQCMVQAPVGIRCRDCGKAVRTPTFDVQPSYYARALAVAAAIGIGGGLLWVAVAIMFGGILSAVAALGVGYAAGELISRSVNRKRGTALAWIAGGTVVFAFLLAWLITGPFIGWFGLLFVLAAVYTAVQRVR